MTHCLFYYRNQTERGYHYECARCGYVITSEPHFTPKQMRHICANPPDLQPAAKKLGIPFNEIPHYAQALARWTVAGWPVRSQADVAAILKTHCTPCPQYEKGKCRKCGCNVNGSWVAVVNKIKMATEACALEKW